jgi:hypothetical protein
MDKKRKFSKLSIASLIIAIVLIIQYFFPFLLYIQESIDPYIFGNVFYFLLANITFYLNTILLISLLIISIISIVFIKKYNLYGIWISIICLVYASLELLGILFLIALLSGLS